MFSLLLLLLGAPAPCRGEAPTTPVPHAQLAAACRLCSEGKLRGQLTTGDGCGITMHHDGDDEPALTPGEHMGSGCNKTHCIATWGNEGEVDCATWWRRGGQPTRFGYHYFDEGAHLLDTAACGWVHAESKEIPVCVVPNTNRVTCVDTWTGSISSAPAIVDIQRRGKWLVFSVERAALTPVHFGIGTTHRLVITPKKDGGLVFQGWHASEARGDVRRTKDGQRIEWRMPHARFVAQLDPRAFRPIVPLSVDGAVLQAWLWRSTRFTYAELDAGHSAAPRPPRAPANPDEDEGP